MSDYTVHVTLGEDEVEATVTGTVYKDGYDLETEFWSIRVDSTGEEYEEHLTGADEDRIEEALLEAWAADDSDQCVEDCHADR